MYIRANYGPISFTNGAVPRNPTLARIDEVIVFLGRIRYEKL